MKLREAGSDVDVDTMGSRSCCAVAWAAKGWCLVLKAKIVGWAIVLLCFWIPMPEQTFRVVVFPIQVMQYPSYGRISSSIAFPVLVVYSNPCSQTRVPFLVYPFLVYPFLVYPFLVYEFSSITESNYNFKKKK